MTILRLNPKSHNQIHILTRDLFRNIVKTQVLNDKEEEVANLSTTIEESLED